MTHAQIIAAELRVAARAQIGQRKTAKSERLRIAVVAACRLIASPPMHECQPTQREIEDAVRCANDIWAGRVAPIVTPPPTGLSAPSGARVCVATAAADARI